MIEAIEVAGFVVVESADRHRFAVDDPFVETDLEPKLVGIAPIDLDLAVAVAGLEVAPGIAVEAEPAEVALIGVGVVDWTGTESFLEALLAGS